MRWEARCRTPHRELSPRRWWPIGPPSVPACTDSPQGRAVRRWLVRHELLIRQAGGPFDISPWLWGAGPWLLVIVAAGSATVGDQVGYMLGRNGKRLVKPDARILKTRHLGRADDYLQCYGPFSLVLARFVPLVRTFVPPLVGASHVRYRTFVVWNSVGGIGWAVIIARAGALLGHVAFVSKNLDLIAVLIAVLSLVPVGITPLRERRANRAVHPRTRSG